MARLSSWRDRAERSLRALEQGASPAQAARAGDLDPRLLAVVAAGRPGDARAVLGQLAGLSAEVRGVERALRTALLWPAAVLVVSLLSSAVLLAWALPALRQLPIGGEGVSVGPWLAGVAALGVALVVLGAMARRRLDVRLVSVWRSLDAWGFLACARALTLAGVPLAVAVRASAAWCAPAVRGGPEAFARELEGGQAGGAALSGLLGAVSAGVLAGAARAGTVDVTLDALVSLAAAVVRREAPRDGARLHTAGLVLAGAALAVAAVAFYSTYVRAVTG